VDLVIDISVLTTNNWCFFLHFKRLKVGCILVCAVKKIVPLYSKLCYFWTRKDGMLKFTTTMANCVENNLWTFCKKIMNYTENNDICSRGVFSAAHCIMIIITRIMFMVLSSWLRVNVRVHPAQAMNYAKQRQTAADLWTKPTDLTHRFACRLLRNRIHHHYLLLLSPKADTHLTTPQRTEGWVDLDGWLHIPRRFTCPQAVTHPNSNRAQRRLTTLIEANH